MPNAAIVYTSLGVALLFGAAALADTKEIQNHEVQKLFMAEPCSTAIKVIDTPGLNPQGLIKMSMAFGFLMGFEAAHPGIRGTFDTILKRLRSDCEASPDAIAIDLLQGYVDEVEN